MIILNILDFIIACIALITSSIFLVKSLSKISKILGISEFYAAFVIMAIATSIPELFIGISSAFSNNPQLSLGNIIGANILDLTLIIGIIIIAGNNINIENKKIKQDTYIMIASIILLTTLYLIGNELSKIDGIILLSFFTIHLIRVFKKKEKDKTKNNNNIKKKSLWLLIFLLSLVFLFISSHFVVESATNIAEELNIPKILIGLFLISFATTLPELTFGLSAIKLHHKQMALGDQIGTVIINTTMIIGIVSLLSPIKVNFTYFITSILFLTVISLFWFFIVSKKKQLSKDIGITLIILYFIFSLTEFFLK